MAIVDIGGLMSSICKHGSAEPGQCAISIIFRNNGSGSLKTIVVPNKVGTNWHICWYSCVSDICSSLHIFHTIIKIHHRGTLFVALHHYSSCFIHKVFLQKIMFVRELTHYPRKRSLQWSIGRSTQRKIDVIELRSIMLLYIL